MKIISKKLREMNLEIILPIEKGTPYLNINGIKHIIHDAEFVEVVQSINKSNNPNEIITNTKELWIGNKLKETITSIMADYAENEFDNAIIDY